MATLRYVSQRRKDIYQLHSRRRLTIREIALELDMKYDAVRMMLVRIGVKPNPEKIVQKKHVLSKLAERRRVVPRGRRKKFNTLLNQHWKSGASPAEIVRIVHSKVQVRVKPNTLASMAVRLGYKRPPGFDRAKPISRYTEGMVL